VERLDASASQQKSKSKGNESEQQFPQLPNLTTKVVHDGTAFMDRFEHQQNVQQKSKGNVTVNQLPNLHAKDVQDGTRFLDVVENLDQSM